MQDDPKLALQVRVSKMLGYGFAFSQVWAAGVGSIIALIIGVRARRLIRQSNGEVSGIGMAWWCIIVGAFGALTILPYVIWLLLNASKK
jgi:hypothetical protein